MREWTYKKTHYYIHSLTFKGVGRDRTRVTKSTAYKLFSLFVTDILWRFLEKTILTSNVFFFLPNKDPDECAYWGSQIDIDFVTLPKLLSCFLNITLGGIWTFRKLAQKGQKLPQRWKTMIINSLGLGTVKYFSGPRTAESYSRSSLLLNLIFSVLFLYFYMYTTENYKLIWALTSVMYVFLQCLDPVGWTLLYRFLRITTFGPWGVVRFFILFCLYE